MNRVSTWLTVVLLCLMASSSFAGDPPLLRPGQSVERTIASGERHDHHLGLTSNQYLLLEIDQLGFDVVVRLYDPEGEQLLDVDQAGKTGTETVSFFASTTGIHRVEITPCEEPSDPGAYVLEVVRLEETAATPAGRIDQELSRWNRPGSPGAAIAVVRAGEIVHAAGYGRADLEHDIPITPKTVFDIASVAKQFTGLTIAMLVAQGVLSLDDDYRTHLPEMPDYGPTVTVGHLVHHTSGIRDWPGTLRVAGVRMGDVISFERILTLARNLRELNFPPGEEQEYSNTNYNLLAEIVARVTGKPFPEWTAEQLFEPLGMTNTHFQHDPETVVRNRAWGYYRGRDGQLRRSSNNLTALGSSSLFTTVEDLARWAANFDTKSVGGPEAMALMHRPGRLSDGTTLDYGYGVSLGEHRGLSTAAHTGGWASYRTILVRFPERRLAVIVLANTAAFDSEGVALRIADLYLEEEMMAAEQATVAAATVSPGTHPQSVTVAATFEVESEVLDDYAGYYQRENGQIVNITPNGGGLMAYLPGMPPFPLLPTSEDVFAMPETGARVQFTRDEDQRVSGATYSLGEFLLHLDRLAAIEPDERALAEYAGRYYSSELETFYSFEVRNGRLFANHRRHGKVALSPTLRDEFTSRGRPLGRLVFGRGEGGDVTHVLLSTDSRVRNLRFERLAR